MSDLIERLRYSRDCCGSLCEEAADRIAELEAEKTQARGTAEYWKAEHLAGNARIAELKSALDKAAMHVRPTCGGLYEELLEVLARPDAPIPPTGETK